MSVDWITTYLKNIREVSVKIDATEFSYRTDIQNMLNKAVKEFVFNVSVLHESSRIKGVGAPDFRIDAEGGGVIGYIECKKPGDDLQKLIGGTQIKRYKDLSSNILLTDCWRWLLLRNGKKIADVNLMERLDKKIIGAFQDLLRIFMEGEAEKIGDAKRLAIVLARRCAWLREGLKEHNNDSQALHDLLKAFQAALDTNLSFEKFSDAFAQTLVYSLLLAKLKAPVGAKLGLYNINEYIPANFAVIRDIAMFAQKLDNPKYKNTRWVVDDILAIINTMDGAAVSESMSYRRDGKAFDDFDDPYIYFYENFLAVYDAKLRERRGVYYTPPPVVKFIVRSVNDLLRRDFGLSDGFAETDAVTVLDFAAGTGTFMLEMMRTVLSGIPLARQDMLIHNHILKNFQGFELLIAPYTIAHLKLSQFLADNDVPLKDDERISIFLTNTLDRKRENGKQKDLIGMPELANDVKRAQEIKDTPVLVITGNPPYSGHSQNTGKWIMDLMKAYKQVDGKPLDEKNSKWLDDDYVKFFRFAQDKMDQTPRGIVAIITNHGFLDNPTFLGMRKSLLETFDTLYFLDLHGNTKKRAIPPEGGRDENVFDIQQGVAISILVKNPNAKQKGVFHDDLWGSRDKKYKKLKNSETTIKTIDWKKLTPTAPSYLFIPHDDDAAEKYQKFYSLKNMFVAQSSAIATHRDHFAYAFDANEVKTRINKMIDDNVSTKSLREEYNLKDTADWGLMSARTSLRDNYSFKEYLKPCSYRPFDTRWCYYGKETMNRPRPALMRHILAGDNLVITSTRQAGAIGGDTFHAVFVTDLIIDVNLNRRGGAYCFPAYRYDDVVGKVTRNENLKPEFRRWIDDRYGITHSPEDILGCIYAILHSPNYRERYADFLRTDFPRIPFPGNNDEFKRLACIGGDLIKSHLLRSNCTGGLAEHKGNGTSHKVERIHYDVVAENLYFNKDEYFSPVPPDVFNFQIGGYKLLDKYLKSRKNRTLSISETETIQKTANAIGFTIEKIKEIDQ